ncbi:nucleoside diphosphate kinase regulator [Rhizobiaceae bacterium n13]|uniref:Nucleoside diphosphate kinase regulator n=1 Tax=Ferirhizobium litorale TaxID=2927786 RepID=A0AAE3Q9Z9_9HYPH|nr:nucleoside diphosphate kinase regulator [Fererhizobium litorale]MDI7861721.1 nucleoside diphosphate kinase regulator [Fererhizobium litorale]MDI7921937.1 nucleoside diphosphate kinase regulator [Fererhizobium litorale]
MQQKTRATRKPHIVVTKSDHRILLGLANAVSHHDEDIAEALIDELERAKIVADTRISANIVRLGSIVDYHAEGATRTVTLVLPVDADISKGRVSILTPIGTALLGLSPSQSMEWTARDGRIHRLTVKDVRQVESVSPSP